MLTKTRRAIVAMLAIPMVLAAAPAYAAQEAALLIFYGALKVSQTQAISAAANYYVAIGMGQQAQQYTRLARDFESGSLGGADGIKTFTQASANLAGDIYELQAVGALPTARERELAKKAQGQFATARVAMVAAIASGTYAAIKGDGNMLQKILVGGLLAAEALKVNTALQNVSSAAQAYRTFELGGANGFQIVSNEIAPQFAGL